MNRSMGDTLLGTPPGFLERGVETLQSRLGAAVGSSRDAILMYHAVGEPPEAGYFGNVSSERFRASIEYLAANATIVPLSSIPDETSERRVAITFDDGLRSVYTEALPVLREFEVPATVFVNPGFLDGRNRETVRSRHGVDDDGRVMLTDAELYELAESPLVTVGNHTLTHRDLSTVTDRAELHAEVVDSKQRLADRYGVAAAQFSYPHGATSEQARAVVEAHHELSVTTAPFLVGRDGPHLLPRLGGHKPHRTVRWELTPAGDRLNRVRHRLASSYSR